MEGPQVPEKPENNGPSLARLKAKAAPPLVWPDNPGGKGFPAPSGLTIARLGTMIGRHITAGDRALLKAERHYTAAGGLLREAHKRVKRTTSLEWEVWTKHHAKITKARVIELIGIARGKFILVAWSATKAYAAKYRRALRGDSIEDAIHGATLTNRAADVLARIDYLKRNQEIAAEFKKAEAEAAAPAEIVPEAPPAYGALEDDDDDDE